MTPTTRRTALLDGLPEAEFDRITRMAAALAHAPIALFSLPTQDRQVLKSAVGLTGPAGRTRETPLEQSLCRHVVARDAPLVLSDLREHPELDAEAAHTVLGVVAYAGYPVHDADGIATGALCAIDDVPHTWTPQELEALADLAEVVGTELRLRAALARQEASARLLASATRLAHEHLERAEAREAELRGDRGDRLHALAHEMRTPLYSIRGLTEVILELERSAPPALVDDLVAIDVSASEALRVIDRELALARSIADPARARLEELDLAALLTGVQAMMAPLGTALGVEVGIAPCTGVERIASDPLRLGQLLRQLLSLALQTTTADRLVLSVLGGVGGTLELRVVGDGSAPVRTSGADARIAVIDGLARALGGRLQQSAGALVATIARDLQPRRHVA